ncbi:uncharacterized protein LOC111021613 [Momordica charantia]|uniref:Uncharacterized protein LOC111021613 n=1 Tax=Momordica charantia TaxID=3673 RepID=A0A6J1DK06_MOMCH|nr:uncharacterized protein LOC111021613 [Momordica charantia]
MTDLGVLRYFLGLEVSHSSIGIYVNQAKYARDVLIRFGMLASKPCHTTIALTAPSDVGSPCTVEDAHNYGAMVGALQYLTFSRPDIAFSVRKLSQHMHAPFSSHLITAKRVLRYINGSLHVSLLFKKGGSVDEALRLRAFSDSDWAGDPSYRRSTTGFVVFLDSNPISWAVKKQTTVSRSSTEAEYRALAINCC